MEEEVVPIGIRKCILESSGTAKEYKGYFLIVCDADGDIVTYCEGNSVVREAFANVMRRTSVLNDEQNPLFRDMVIDEDVCE